MGLRSAIGLVDAEISSDVRARWGASNLEPQWDRAAALIGSQ